MVCLTGLVYLTIFLLCADSQPPPDYYDYDGPPPPWMRRHRHRGRHWRNRRPPWGRPPPPPPPPPPPVGIPPPQTMPPAVNSPPRPIWIPRLQTDANKIDLPFSSTSSELGPNRHVAGALFEVDMVLTVAQANRVAAAGGRRRRMLHARAAALWPTVIPYTFNENDLEWRGRILQSIQHMERNTCIRFSEQYNPSGDHITFTRGEGCMSALGRLGGAQQVSVGYGCEQLGIISHELFHALGFWHEHTRPDRDSYLRVNRQNILPGVEGQFLKRTTTESETQGLPFDYASVMHYAANSYSQSSTLFTLDPTDSLYRSTIGSRSEPSFIDYKHVNSLYCSRVCRVLPCQNGGYTDPNNCWQCKCPVGLGGTYCEQVQSSVCGMELTADSYWRKISFSGSSDCYWRVRAPQRNLHVEFELTHVFFACAPSCDEYVEMKWLGDLSLAGGRLCCHPEGGLRTTVTDVLVVIAKARRSSQFTLRYRVQGGRVSRERPITSPSVSRNPAPVWNQASNRQGQWTAWSLWSDCTERCGACGTHTRARACSSGSCQGSANESGVCNMNACVRGATLPGKKRRRKRSDYWCCQGYALNNYRTCVRT